MKNKFIRCVFCGVGIGILGFIIGAILVMFTTYSGKFDTNIFIDKISLICLAAGFVIGFFLPLTKKSKKDTKIQTKGKTASGNEFDIHFDAHFMTDQELYNANGLINTTWKDLPSLKKTGLVVRNQYKNGKYEITMKDEIHCLVIGTTGSGKTSMIINPSIRILAHSAEKPSIVVTDPKGELYEAHAEAMKKEGYKVVVYDLDNPFVSSRWNPLENSFRQYQRAMHLGKEAKIYRDCTPDSVGKKKIEGETYGPVWYEFNGVAFPTEEALKIELNSVKQQLINETTAELRGIAATVCPVDPNTQDKTWEQGAQDYLYGIMLGMLEDSVDERLGENKLRIDQFNFYNLYKIANRRDSDPDNPFGSLKKYCGGRPIKSNVTSLTSPVINNATNTTKSYMGVLSGKISSLMEDMGICYATSGSDINFKDFVKEPTIFFIKCPDHKKERHPLATVCIAQLYRALVDVANGMPRKILPRHVFFLLDEFGNLPVIPDFATMVTVARSRNIFFEIIVQSYAQLDTKYGKDISETLKGNFNAQIFLGTDDQQTKDAFSKSCGEVQVTYVEKSKSESKGKDPASKSTSENEQIQRSTRPLIDPTELGQLPFGTGIVRLFRLPPLKINYTQFHKTTEFAKIPSPEPLLLSKSLNESKVFFDIDKRNEIIYGKQRRWSDF